jgi:cytidylate kinase
MTKSFLIAIDGPTASGKGTLARNLARRFALAYLDTGSLYRAVGRDVLAAGLDPADAGAAAAKASALDAASLADPRLRNEDVGQAASIVAAHPAVRAALLGFQRDFAARPPGGMLGAVLDGRDIGTVVCPEAALKLFVTATTEARAERRFNELRARGEEVSYEEVLADLQARDARDSGRAAAPLKPAADAVLIDTTDLDAERVLAHVTDLVKARV